MDGVGERAEAQNVVVGHDHLLFEGPSVGRHGAIGHRRHPYPASRQRAVVLHES
jgi:hypothetical protein